MNDTFKYEKVTHDPRETVYLNIDGKSKKEIDGILTRKKDESRGEESWYEEEGRIVGRVVEDVY